MESKGKKRSREESSAEGAAAAVGGSAPAAAPAGDFAIYAEGWPYDSSDADIRAFFAACGPLRDLKAPRWQDSGRLRGYVHARFDSPAAVAAALALSGTAVGARFITVKVPNPLGGGRAPPPLTAPPGCRTVHVHNLPYDCDEAAISKAFQRFGNVASVRIARRYDTLASKGFAYVEFEGKAGVEAAVAASLAPGGLLVGGRAARLDYDTGTGPKASFKTADGRSFAKAPPAAAGGGGGGQQQRGAAGKGSKRPNAGVAAHSE